MGIRKLRARPGFLPLWETCPRDVDLGMRAKAWSRTSFIQIAIQQVFGYQFWCTRNLKQALASFLSLGQLRSSHVNFEVSVQRKDRISQRHKSSTSATPGARKSFQPEDMTASKVLTKERKKTNDQVEPLKEATYSPSGEGQEEPSRQEEQPV